MLRVLGTLKCDPSSGFSSLLQLFRLSCLATLYFLGCVVRHFDRIWNVIMKFLWLWSTNSFLIFFLTCSGFQIYIVAANKFTDLFTRIESSIIWKLKCPFNLDGFRISLCHCKILMFKRLEGPQIRPKGYRCSDQGLQSVHSSWAWFVVVHAFVAGLLLF